MFESELFHGAGLPLVVEPAYEGSHTHWLAADCFHDNRFPGHSIHRLILFTEEEPKREIKASDIVSGVFWRPGVWGGDSITIFDERKFVGERWAMRPVPSVLVYMTQAEMAYIPVTVRPGKVASKDQGAATAKATKPQRASNAE